MMWTMSIIAPRHGAMSSLENDGYFDKIIKLGRNKQSLRRFLQ